jgi:hypothetical protein
LAATGDDSGYAWVSNHAGITIAHMAKKSRKKKARKKSAANHGKRPNS